MHERNERPVRILHVVQSLGTGGLENGVVNLANKIDRSRYQLDVLCLRFRGELCDRLTSESKVYFDESTATSIPRSLLSVKRHCQDGGYHVIHTHGLATLLPGVIGARLAGNVRIINGEHGTFFVDTARRRAMQKVLFRLVDANCTVSRSLRDEMYSLFRLPKTRIKPILNGVDIDRFTPDRGARIRSRHSLGFRSDDVVFGTVGRLVPVKDYATLIAGFRQLAEDRPTARLLFVGDGSEMRRLREIGGELCESGNIVFLGNRDDVPLVMNAMDVFCLTSLREGLSNTLLEAHACGLPVIATDTGGNGEVVAHQETGFLFPVGDSGTLAKYMLSLIDDAEMRKALGLAARVRAQNMFSIETMVQGYEELYENVFVN